MKEQHLMGPSCVVIPLEEKQWTRGLVTDSTGDTTQRRGWEFTRG